MKHLEKVADMLNKTTHWLQGLCANQWPVILTHQTKLPLEREVQLHNWYSVSVTHCIKKK